MKPSSRPSVTRTSDSPLVPLEPPPRASSLRFGGGHSFLPIDTLRKSYSPSFLNHPSNEPALLTKTGRFTPSSSRVASPMRARSGGNKDENENHYNTTPRAETDFEKENKRGRLRLPHKKKAKTHLGPKSKLVPPEAERETAQPLTTTTSIDENVKMPGSAMEEEEEELASFPPAVTASDEKPYATQPRPFLFTPLREQALSPSPMTMRTTASDRARCPQLASGSRVLQGRRFKPMVDDRVPLVAQQHGCIFTSPVDAHPTRMEVPCLAAPAPAASHFGGEPIPFLPRPPYAPYFGAAPAGMFGGAAEPPCASPITPAAFPYMLRPEPVRAENQEEVGEEGAEEHQVPHIYAAATQAPGSAMVVEGAAL